MNRYIDFDEETDGKDIPVMIWQDLAAMIATAATNAVRAWVNPLFLTPMTFIC